MPIIINTYLQKRLHTNSTSYCYKAPFISFICKYTPLKQWAYEDSHSPKHQKFKVDELSRIKTFIKQDWQFLLNTIYGDTPNPSSPFKDATARLFQKTSSVLCVALPTTSSTITTVAKRPKG